MGLFVHWEPVKIPGMLLNFCVADLVGHCVSFCKQDLDLGSVDHTRRVVASPLRVLFQFYWHQCLLTMMYWIQCWARWPLWYLRIRWFAAARLIWGFRCARFNKKLSPVSLHTSPGGQLTSPLYVKMSHFPANVSNSNRSVTLKWFPAHELFSSHEALEMLHLLNKKQGF